MKHALLFLSAGLLAGCPALAQDLTNAGAAITVQPGATVYVGTGGLSNRAGGTLTTAGSLRVDGPLTNAGTLNLSTGALEARGDVTNAGTLTPGTSTVTFSGTANQLLTPGGATLYQVLVSKPTAGANTLRLAGDLTISHLLQLGSGYVNTQAPGGTVYTLRLPDGASISGEASGRYVQGALQVTRAAVSSAPVDFGLGAILDPDGNNLGTVSITRTAGLKLADVSYGQNLGPSPKGIDRIWTVTPATQPSTPVDLTLSWLPDDDNGLVGFSKVQLWQQPTTGQPWTAVGPLANASTRLFSSSPTVLNRFTVSNNASAVPATTLASFTPNSGLAGSTFAITGTNLSGATTITFTPTSGPATAVTSGFVVANSTSITGVPVPAGLAAGVYTVTVTATAGVSNSLPFTVTTSASTATPVVTAPTAGQVLATTTPTYAGTAPAGSTVTVYVDNASIGTTTALGTGSFSLAQPTALAQGLHQVYATAQLSGQPVSTGSAPISFTVDTVAPTVASLSSSAGASGGSTSTTPLPFSVTFSEPVTGFSAAGISVTNGTVTSGPTGSGAGPYTFSVTPTTPGTATTVTIAANAAQDAAGTGNAASAPFSLTYVAGPSVATTWTGTTSTDWFTASNWNPGVPTTTSDASILGGTPFSPVLNAGTATTRALTIGTGASLVQVGGTLDVRGNLTNNGTFSPLGGTVVLGTVAVTNGPAILGSSPVRFWDLTIDANGAQLGTSAGASVRHVLTLTGSLTTQGNRFTVESASTGDALVVNNGGAVVGAATVQRYIDPSANPGLGYRHYSAPVSTSTVADLSTAGFTPVVNPAYNTSATPAAEVPFPTVFGYDESRTLLTNNLNSFDKGYFSPAALSDPLAVGRGYSINLAASQLVDFVGALNNDVIPVALTNNRASNADAGWHLVGNPYPSPLNYSLVATADKVNLEGAIYVYSSTSQYGGNYRTYLNGMGNPVIPMGQGFFVRTAGTSAGTLTFRNSQRLTVPNVTTFQRTTETRPLVQLTLQAAGSAGSRGLLDELYVYAQTGATAGFDADFDAKKLPNPTGLNLSAEAAGQQLAIDGRPELSTGPQVVPLAVGVPTPGSYTLTAAQLLNLATVPVYLRDLQAGALIDLAQQPTYSFAVANASALITGRFELVFSPQQALATAPAALAQQVALYPNPATTSAWLELPPSLSRHPVTATLVDAVGRVVRTQVLPAGQTSHSLQLAELATGVYALRLSTEAGVVVKRLVMK